MRHFAFGRLEATLSKTVFVEFGVLLEPIEGGEKRVDKAMNSVLMRSQSVVVALEIVDELVQPALPVVGFSVLVHIRRFAIRVAVEFVEVVRHAVEGVVNQSEFRIVGGKLNSASVHLRSRMEACVKTEESVPEEARSGVTRIEMFQPVSYKMMSERDKESLKTLSLRLREATEGLSERRRNALIRVEIEDPAVLSEHSGDVPRSVEVLDNRMGDNLRSHLSGNLHRSVFALHIADDGLICPALKRLQTLRNMALFVTCVDDSGDSFQKRSDLHSPKKRFAHGFPAQNTEDVFSLSVLGVAMIAKFRDLEGREYLPPHLKGHNPLIPELRLERIVDGGNGEDDPVRQRDLLGERGADLRGGKVFQHSLMVNYVVTGSVRFVEMEEVAESKACFSAQDIVDLFRSLHNSGSVIYSFRQYAAQGKPDGVIPGADACFAGASSLWAEAQNRRQILQHIGRLPQSLKVPGNLNEGNGVIQLLPFLTVIHASGSLFLLSEMLQASETEIALPIP